MNRTLNDFLDPLILFCIFLPYFGIGALPADTQPFAILFISISLLINKSILPKYFSLIFILINVYFFMIAAFSFFDGSISFLGIIRYITALYTPFIIFLYAFNRLPDKDLLKRALDFVLAFIGLGFVLNILGLTEINQLFVNRANFLEDSAARSFTSFFPEQSRISTQTILIFFTYSLIGKLNIIRALTLLVYFALGLSGQSFLFLLAFGAVYLLASISKLNLSSTAILTVTFFVIIQLNPLDYLLDLNFATRGVSAAIAIYERGLSYFASDIGLLYKTTGIVYGLAPFFSIDKLFTFGLYSTQDPNFIFENMHIEMIYSYYFNSSFVPIPMVPYSIFGVLLTDHGIVGLLIIGLLIFNIFKTFIKLNLNGRAAILFLLFLILVRSVLASPTLWFLFFFLILSINTNNTKDSL